MSYETWFHHGTWYNPEYRVNLYGYFRDPEKLTQKDIDWQEQSAARCIAEAQELIADLQEHRKALAARYAELASAPYKLRLELKREAGWRGKGVDYYVNIYRTYDDGTEVMELNEHYTGKQRREALARFEELKKQRPGIEAVKDIERRSWER